MGPQAVKTAQNEDHDGENLEFGSRRVHSRKGSCSRLLDPHFGRDVPAPAQAQAQAQAHD